MLDRLIAEASVTFRVEATLATLAETVKRLRALGEIESDGVAQSVLAKIEAAESAVARGNTRAALGALTAFSNEVAAQRGEHVTEWAADVLPDGRRLRARAVVAASAGPAARPGPSSPATPGVSTRAGPDGITTLEMRNATVVPVAPPTPLVAMTCRRLRTGAAARGDRGRQRNRVLS